MLGRQAVVHRKHRAAGALADEARRVVRRVEPADHPAAPVQEDEQRGARVIAGRYSRAGMVPAGPGMFSSWIESTFSKFTPTTLSSLNVLRKFVAPSGSFADPAEVPPAAPALVHQRDLLVQHAAGQGRALAGRFSSFSRRKVMRNRSVVSRSSS